MSDKQIKPYGAWSSSITTDLIVSSTIGLGEIQLHKGKLFWIEMRPEEKGRYVVVEKQGDIFSKDRIPEPFNARTRVHEYGGGSYLAHNDDIYFSNFHDQGLYRVKNEESPLALVEVSADRFADFVIDEVRNRLISVMESHNSEEEARNYIVSINNDPNDKKVSILTEGADFYSTPRVSPDGKQLAWICWHHPNMPWDDSELWLADLEADGGLTNQRRIAGGLDESIFQPEWSPNGTLYFVSDRNGWWNLYTYKENRIEIIVEMEAEFAVPQWSFRESTYVFINDDRIICTFSRKGISYLAEIDTRTRILKEIAVPFTDIESLQADEERVVFLAAAPDTLPQIVSLDLNTQVTDIIRSSSELRLEPDYISVGESIEFPTENNLTAHGFYYQAKNPDFEAGVNEKSPLIVFSHGGPTGMSRNGLKMVIQYFTSRGIAVLDVNYGGSSGYGRAYRKRLNGHWGIVDVDDCVNGALYLAEQGKVDKERLAIRGGSAGGFTTLAALTFKNVFKAGCSRYGVSDLEALTKETHKFESRYLDTLIGPYPEKSELYKSRSPIHAVERLSCPVIFFQGLEDKIVLPNQAEMMVDALRKKGLPVAYIPFAEEQHGFRQADNIKRALDGEFYFFSKVFKFNPADNLEPLHIENLTST